jgi:predicted permease
MAIRQSLGASRARIFRETLAEGVVLAAGGLALGIFFGFCTGRALELLLPSLPMALYQGLQLGIDWRVALFLAAAGVLCAILFSLPPALANSRRGLNPAMRGQDFRNSRQREIYSVVQVALSLTLLIATGLLLRALDRVQHIDPGFASDHRVYVDLRDSGRASDTLVAQARELPGVEEATMAWRVFPGSGAGCADTTREARPRAARTNTVDPNYFDMMRIPIVKGSGFARAASFTETPNVIVNETMARTLWPGQDPLGKTVWVNCPQFSKQKFGTVIGVARDAKYDSLDEEPQPFYYLSRREDRGNDYWALIVRTAADPRQWTKPLLDLVQRNGGNLSIYDSDTLDDAVAHSLWLVKWQASLLGAMGLLAIVLASIGVYGVVACSVSQRTREIGVRMALGAVPLDVQWMVLAHGLRITAIGIAAGLLLSGATVRLLRGFLYGLSPFDPVAFAAASLAWIAIAMVASWYPARRATRVDPVTALNYE